jgi:hypothetical protein
MLKGLATVFAMSLISLSLASQTAKVVHAPGTSKEAALSFDFKGDAIGETLQQFKDRNAHTATYEVFFLDSDGDTREGSKLKIQLPICTGDKEESNPDLDLPELKRSEQEVRLGIIRCVVTPHQQGKSGKDEWGYWSEFPTIADSKTLSSIYRFYKDKLYSIEITFAFTDYDRVTNALIAKFGMPRSKENRAYRSGSGTKLHDEVLVWKRKTSSLTANAVYGATNISSVVFTDDELAAAVKSATETPAREDL